MNVYSSVFLLSKMTDFLSLYVLMNITLNCQWRYWKLRDLKSVLCTFLSKYIQAIYLYEFVDKQIYQSKIDRRNIEKDTTGFRWFPRVDNVETPGWCVLGYVSLVPYQPRVRPGPCSAP